MIVIETNKMSKFPPIKIPLDGTKIGITQLKNIIDITLTASFEVKNIKDLKEKNWLAKLFGGYIRFAVFLLDTSVDIYKAAPILAKEVKDLDYTEINELVLHIAKTWELDETKAQHVFDVFKKTSLWLEDGIITFAELKDF